MNKTVEGVANGEDPVLREFLEFLAFDTHLHPERMRRARRPTACGVTTMQNTFALLDRTAPTTIVSGGSISPAAAPRRSR